jgi:hypothetical protein
MFKLLVLREVVLLASIVLTTNVCPKRRAGNLPIRLGCASPIFLKANFVDVLLKLVTLAAFQNITVILARNVRKKRDMGKLALIIMNAKATDVFMILGVLIGLEFVLPSLF